jgi:hypothetical protein
MVVDQVMVKLIPDKAASMFLTENHPPLWHGLQEGWYVL